MKLLFLWIALFALTSSKLILFRKELEILRKEIDDTTFQKNLSSNKNIRELERLYNMKQIEFLPNAFEKKRIAQIEEFWTKKENEKELVCKGGCKSENIEKEDENSSRLLIDKFKKDNQESVMEFAAGNGRVTKNVLIKKFKHVEALEPISHLAEKIKEISSPNLKAVYVQKAENFEFPHKFDFIWGQWILENLTDLDVIKILIKCRDNLNENGKIVFKENIENKSLSVDSDSGQRIRTKQIYI